MVCIYCRHSTRVVNSRHQKRYNNIWRRRFCEACAANFTTLEKADLSAGFMVDDAGSTHSLTPFLREKLFLSVYSSCRHRSTALTDAINLTETIVGKLLFLSRPVLSTKEIALTVHEVLKNFDAAAATFYDVYHPKKITS